jgi:putative DNA primase/helicase
MVHKPKPPTGSRPGAAQGTVQAGGGYARFMRPVALTLLGNPNRVSPTEWRYGTNGSLSIDLENGVWYDHENQTGGGVLALIFRETGCMNGEAVEWLKQNGFPVEDIASYVLRGPAIAVTDTADAEQFRVVETWAYDDVHGELIFQVQRLENGAGVKRYRQRRRARPDDPPDKVRAGWIYNVKGVPQVPYRLPELIEDLAQDRLAFVVEGEKCVDALRRIGIPATTNAQGAGKWSPELDEHFRDADVVLIPDNDPPAKVPDGSPRLHPDGRPVRPGQDHMDAVAKRLLAVAKQVRILELPELPPKGDVVDWLEAGGSAEKLYGLVDSAAVSCSPDAAKDWEVARTPKPGGKKSFVIRINPGELHAQATQAESALRAVGTPFYQNSAALVRPVVDVVDAARGCKTKTARLLPVTVDAMLDHLSRSGRWEKYSKTNSDWQPTDPPRQVAQIILSRDGEWTFPRLAGVLTTPTIRPDGTILKEPGYDPATRLLLVDPPKLPLMPERPTREHAQCALEALDELLRDFPFASKASRAVALSALITPVGRGALPVAPLHAMSAPAAGSGKTYLVDCASAIATGQRCPVIAAASNDAETEKRLGAALLAGYPVLSIDNLNGPLQGDQLCQAIERPSFDIRVLGFSQLKRIESRSTLFATGNNITPTGDVVRRVLMCRLDPNVERPELRAFPRDPLGAIQGDRGRYIAAALTIVRAYAIAGSPNPCPELLSFGEWSRMVRSALVWLGVDDPVATIDVAHNDDPDVARMSAIWSAWEGSNAPTERLTVGELIVRAETYPKLRQALFEVAEVRGGIDGRRLGQYLRQRAGRIINGLKLVGEEDRSRKQNVWSLQPRQGAASPA